MYTTFYLVCISLFVVEYAITEFEFSVAPPSNFHQDESVIMLLFRKTWEQIRFSGTYLTRNVHIPLRIQEIWGLTIV